MSARALDGARAIHLRFACPGRNFPRADLRFKSGTGKSQKQRRIRPIGSPHVLRSSSGFPGIGLGVTRPPQLIYCGSLVLKLAFLMLTCIRDRPQESREAATFTPVGSAGLAPMCSNQVPAFPRLTFDWWGRPQASICGLLALKMHFLMPTCASGPAQECHLSRNLLHQLAPANSRPAL